MNTVVAIITLNVNCDLWSINYLTIISLSDLIQVKCILCHMDCYCVHNDICFFCVGLCTSIGIPLIINNTLIGALGLNIDHAYSMLNDSMLSYIDPDRHHYFFIISLEGHVLMHPMLPKYRSYMALPTMVHIRFLEREAHRSGIIASMMRYGLYFSV